MTKEPKLDLIKLHKDEYAMSKRPQLIDVKEAQYLTISGKGEPGGSEFAEKLGALYGVAYTIKFARKKNGGQDYKVCALEGLWWGMGPDFESSTPKNEWQWKLLVRTPDFVTQNDLENAVAELEKKGRSETSADVKLETIAEGQCVQMLHVGPYDAERQSVEAMEQFVAQQGLRLLGVHHEIYFSDPRRVPPERLKTLLRHPVRRCA